MRADQTEIEAALERVRASMPVNMSTQLTHAWQTLKTAALVQQESNRSNMPCPMCERVVCICKNMGTA